MLLGDVAGGRNNNFTLIRMLAATGVLVSHAFPMALGEGTPEPFELATGYTLGWVCVAIFFAISGFLIARSFDRTARIEDWFSARVMRLFPGLIVVSILTLAIYGPVFTTLSLGEYFASPRTWTYVPRNVTLVSLQYDLPGVFADHPVPRAINGSLWTLVHEVACYVGVLLAGVLGALRSKKVFAVLCAIYFIAFAITALPAVADSLPYKLAAFRKLSFPFLLGTMFYVWSDRLRLDWVSALALAAATVLLHGTVLFEIFFVTAIAYGTFVLAYRPGGWLRRYNDLGDYSYGMYVFAFPVQQAAIELAGPMSPLTNMVMALPVTLLLAVLSWYIVEQPSLTRRHHLARLLGRLRRDSPEVASEKV